MTAFSYLVYPTNQLNEDFSVQDGERQKKITAELIRKVSNSIKIQNAKGYKYIGVAFANDYTKGGRGLYTAAEDSSPMKAIHLGLMHIDNIRVDEQDKSAVQTYLHEVFTVDYVAKGYTVVESTLYDKRVHVVTNSAEPGMPVTVVTNEFVPIKHYRIGWV